MPSLKKSAEELDSELAEQMLALRASEKAYDEGNLWEAKRLASSIYILLFDGTGRTKSLLGLTGHKKGLKLYSTLDPLPPLARGSYVVAQSATSMLGYRFDGKGGVAFDPPLEKTTIKDKNWLPFSKWLDEELFAPISGISLSRKNVIFSMRSQDGGAHVDRAITSAHYRTFAQTGDPSFTIADGGGLVGNQSGKPLPNGVRAMVRQIAWEVDLSLQKIDL